MIRDSSNTPYALCFDTPFAKLGGKMSKNAAKGLDSAEEKTKEQKSS